MAIQISEHKLSPLAQQALNNAKNKSQFLRDAIEYYVSSELNNLDIKEDIKEIKNILKQLASQTVYDETVATKNEEEKENITVNINSNDDIKKTVDNVNNTESNKQLNIESKETKNETINKSIKSNATKDELTEKQKKYLEDLIDNSLGI